MCTDSGGSLWKVDATQARGEVYRSYVRAGENQTNRAAVGRTVRCIFQYGRRSTLDMLCVEVVTMAPNLPNPPNPPELLPGGVRQMAPEETYCVSLRRCCLV